MPIKLPRNLTGKTNAELVQLAQQIRELPEYQMPSGSFWLYTEKARKLLRRIDWAIYENLKEARALAGNPIPTSGYSGRQTKRRR